MCLVARYRSKGCRKQGLQQEFNNQTHSLANENKYILKDL